MDCEAEAGSSRCLHFSSRRSILPATVLATPIYAHELVSSRAAISIVRSPNSARKCIDSMYTSAATTSIPSYRYHRGSFPLTAVSTIQGSLFAVRPHALSSMLSYRFGIPLDSLHTSWHIVIITALYSASLAEAPALEYYVDIHFVSAGQHNSSQHGIRRSDHALVLSNGVSLSFCVSVT